METSDETSPIEYFHGTRAALRESDAEIIN